MKNRIAAVVVAAGASTRMGPDRNKLVEPIGQAPLVTWPVDALLAVDVEPVLVVTGHQSDRVRAALGERPVRFAHNDDWAEGLGSSIACGARALEGAEITGLFVCLGDLPRLTRGLIEKLAEAHTNAGLDSICVPVHGGRRGHPVLFGLRVLPDLVALTGDQGARNVLVANQEHVIEVDWPDDSIHFDIDTPADLEAARSTPS